MARPIMRSCSTQDKVDLCLEKGADKGLIYPSGELGRDEQKALSNEIKTVSGGGVDIIYDAVGGAYSEPSLRAMNWEGRFLVIGFPAGIPKLPLNLTLLKSCDVRGVFWGAAVARDPAGHMANVKDLFGMYAEGKIKPHVSSTYPLAEAGAAQKQKRAMGKP